MILKEEIVQFFTEYNVALEKKLIDDDGNYDDSNNNGNDSNDDDIVVYTRGVICVSDRLLRKPYININRQLG